MTDVKLKIDKAEQEILLKMFKNGIISVDLETTGLSPLVDKIIEISAAKITPEGIFKFDHLVDPKIQIPQHTIDIHGITNNMVDGKPTIEEILPKYLEFAGDLPVIAHNAQFDLGFIVFNLHKNKLNLPKAEVFCTCIFSRKAFPEMENFKLGTIAKTLEIPLLNHHRAFDDALATLEIFARGLNKFKGQPILNKILDKANIFNTKSFSKNREFAVPLRLQGLEAKTAKQEIVEIKYTGGSYKDQFRPVKPIGLLPLPTGNVLYALCLVSLMHKSFLLKKIAEIRDISEDEVEERIQFLR